MRDFKGLQVWEKAHRLVLAAYRVTGTFPREELYGLTSQLRRASASIPANIAEGCGRSGEAELARFLGMAMGPASELEYHLLLAHDLDLVDVTSYSKLVSDVSAVKRMLTAFFLKRTADG